ncbi:hypothetical protein [Mesorhizobium sp. KR1-2]|uniref:hypothetical protein n=1 Tax=Mesorhizobium sp. KR1-2 TaxID=3156609 RepID=UPI0032B62004
MLGDDPLVGRVVVDDQQALACEFGRRRRVRRLSRRNKRGGEREGENGSLALGAVDPNVAPHQLDQAFADGKAEAGAAIATGRRSSDLAERLEQPVHPISRDADAGVTDGRFIMPMMPFIGVRISWLIVARKVSLPH